MKRSEEQARDHVAGLISSGAEDDEIVGLAAEMVDIDYMNSWGMTVMEVAIRFERVVVVEALLSLGASPNRRSWNHAAPTPTVHAADRGNYAIASMLCEAGGNVDVVSENGEGFMALVEQRAWFRRRDGEPEPDVEAFRRLYEKYSRRNMVRKHLG